MNLSKPSQKQHCNINQAPSHEQLKTVLRKRKNQKQKILEHIKAYDSISTLEAHGLGILAPAARVLELRKQGYNIDKTLDYNLNGMATYFLNKNEVIHD